MISMSIEESFEQVTFEIFYSEVGEKFYDEEFNYWIEKTLEEQKYALQVAFFRSKTKDSFTIIENHSNDIIMICSKENDIWICCPIKILILKAEKILDKYYIILNEEKIKIATFLDKLFYAVNLEKGSSLDPFLYYVTLLTFDSLGLDFNKTFILEFNEKQIFIQSIVEKMFLNSEGLLESKEEMIVIQVDMFSNIIIDYNDLNEYLNLKTLISNMNA